MIIPPVKDRQDFYVEIVNRCETSLADRKVSNDAYRQYYLQGALGNVRNVMQNRLRDKIDLLSSFIYAQETTKFTVKFAAHVPREQRLYADTLREVVVDDWQVSNAHSLFGEGVTWSLVQGCELTKTLWNGDNVEMHIFSPSCFGVLREDVGEINRQEALVMTFFVSESELNRRLYYHPNREKIMNSVSARRKDESATIPETVNRIIISQVSPNMIGSANVDGQGIRVDYAPRVDDPLVECRELWVWDDALRDGRGDYRVWTCAIPEVTIYDRKNIFIPGEHPFEKICPIPIPDYFWGFSLCGGLVGLQDWRDKRLGQIDRTLDRQLRPSRFGIGAGPLGPDRVLAIDSPGGYHNFASPAAKIETYSPPLPDDAWKMIRDIDEQMNETSRITKTISGAGEAGVRSEGHAMFLGRMAGAPIRKIALTVENTIENVVTTMLHCKAREDKRKYLADKSSEGPGKEFLLSQVDPNYRVKVTAHSSSPIFAEENKAVADRFFDKGIIGKQTYVEMLDPPMGDTILARLPELEAAQQKVAELQAKTEASKIEKNVAQAESYRAKVPGGGLRAVK